MQCHRSEVSGRRLWGLFARRFETPESFFSRFGVVNYCPLAFLAEGGRNITPDRLPRAERALLAEACDEHLLALLSFFRPAVAVGVGRFAESVLKRLVPASVEARCILHPSPASPAANREWSGVVETALADIL